MARTALGATQEGPRFWALVRVLAAFVAVLVVTITAGYSAYLEYTELEPPEHEFTALPATAAAGGRAIETERARMWRRGRLWVLELAGTPVEIGQARGRLTSRLHRVLLDRLDRLVSARFGALTDAFAARMLLRWDTRAADVPISDALRSEMAAMAHELPHAATGGLVPYHRVFLEQIFMDVAQRIQDTVIDGSMFAVTGAGPDPLGTRGNLIVGRSFSLDLGMDFESDRIVSIVRADGKYPFAAVGWAGLAGVVTGINARGIVVAGNLARTDDPRGEQGVPVPILLREVLESADSLDRAVEMLETTEVRTSATVLVADGVARRSVIVEMTPKPSEETRLLRGDDEHTVWATNHLVRDTFERDAQNDRIMRTSSSGYRYTRLSELLEGADADEFTAEDALRILRDRRGHDAVELGLGNGYALDNLFTTHSVVFDATSMVMWVGEGPSALGRFRAFDLGSLLRRSDGVPAAPQDMPADRLLHSQEYVDFRAALDEFEYARRLFSEGRHEAALFSGQVARSLAPDVGELHRLLGDIERELDHDDIASRHYRRYLELVPGRHRDQDRVRGILDELAG